MYPPRMLRALVGYIFGHPYHMLVQPDLVTPSPLTKRLKKQDKPPEESSCYDWLGSPPQHVNKKAPCVDQV